MSPTASVFAHPHSRTPLSHAFRPARVAKPRLAPHAATAAFPEIATVADIAVDTFLPALGMRPEAAVFVSAILASGSVVMNFVGQSSIEQKRAELAMELERDKTFQAQMTELQGVIARYRGPLLESAIDLEQRYVLIKHYTHPTLLLRRDHRTTTRKTILPNLQILTIHILHSPDNGSFSSLSQAVAFGDGPVLRPVHLCQRRPRGNPLPPLHHGPVSGVCRSGAQGGAP